MHVFATWFFPFTHYVFFFTTNCLRNDQLQMKKENVKRRFDKHMGKEILQGEPWKIKSASSENNCPFICVCTLKDLPPTAEPSGIMPTRQPPFFNCSYVPIQTQSVACLKVLVFKASPEFQENPWALGLKFLNTTHLYLNLPYDVRTSERTLSVFIGQITFSNQAYKKSHRAQGVRL